MAGVEQGAQAAEAEAELLRLRIELSDLRRQLLLEQERRAFLALELHRTRNDGGGGRPDPEFGRRGTEAALGRVRAAGAALSEELAKLRPRQEAVAAALEEVRDYAQQLSDELERRGAVISAMRASSSWRLTAPLRGFKLRLKGQGAEPAGPDDWKAAPLEEPPSLVDGDRGTGDRVRALADQLRAELDALTERLGRGGASGGKLDPDG